MKKKVFLALSSIIVLLAILFVFLYFGTDIFKRSASGQTLDLPYKTTSKVGQSGKVIGTVARTSPIVANGGLERYPVYGQTLSNATTDEKQAIIDENLSLIASSTTYNSMDENGNLYLDGQPTGEKLYKHTASENMYYGNVSDSEKAVIKEIDVYNARAIGNYITGLYAPAGEVIKIEISQSELEKTGGLTICIGQTAQRNNKNNIGVNKTFTRMPYIVNEMTINSTTAYVGFALGGPIYVTPKNAVTFSVTISGAVEYMHFIYGQTTQENFEKMKSLSAPYFDFEIYDNSIRHSGSKVYVNCDYDNLCKSANLWEKITRTSKQFSTGSMSSIGISMVYDPYVFAGSAVAIVGQNWCNLPSDWITAALDYQTFTSEGTWGVIHEYNHHFQRFGISPGDEVTNNVVSLISYLLYTNISSSRSDSADMSSYWNNYTNPAYSLSRTLTNSKNGSALNELNIYADILHSFGIEKFVEILKLNGGKSGVDNWYKDVSQVTGYDMTYYFTEIMHQNLSSDAISSVQSQNLPVFVPVASVYQVGRSNIKDGNEVFTETVKPYLVPYDEDLTLDFNKKIILPDDFTFEIKSIENGENLQKIDENIYKLSQKTYHNEKIYITLSINHPTIVTEDVTLVLQFGQKQAQPKRSIYTYSSMPYENAYDAYLANFEGYSSVTTSQSKSHFMNGLSPNMIGVIEGKFYIEESGSYVLCLRAGRGNNILLLSINNNENFKKVIDLTGNNYQFVSTGAQTVTLNLNKGDFVYFKEITLSRGSDAYMELGLGKVNEDQSVTVNALNNDLLYGESATIEEYNFESEMPYYISYQINQIDVDLTGQKIVSVENYGIWDNSYKIENVIDGNNNTAYHNEENHFITSGDPFILTIDLGKVELVNRLTIIGYNRVQVHMPITFDLYGGKDLENLTLLKSIKDATYQNRTLKVDFDDSEIRYYKIVVTDTDTHRYVAIAEINMSYSLDGFYENSPDWLSYKGNFSLQSGSSTFGHTISGNGTISYNFTGSGFGLFVTSGSACTLKVEIDGEKYIYSLSGKEDKTLAFAFQNLQTKQHSISIKITGGNVNVESFIFKP